MMQEKNNQTTRADAAKAYPELNEKQLENVTGGAKSYRGITDPSEETPNKNRPDRSAE